MASTDALRRTASGALIGLVFLCVAWELWLAPIRPGGSWLVLKSLPLLAPLFGVLRGKRYTYQWASMFILAYFCEGVMRAWGDKGLSQQLAMLEIVLSLTFFVAAVAYARLTRAVVSQPSR